MLNSQRFQAPTESPPSSWELFVHKAASVRWLHLNWAVANCSDLIVLWHLVEHHRLRGLSQFDTTEVKSKQLIAKWQPYLNDGVCMRSVQRSIIALIEQGIARRCLDRYSANPLLGLQWPELESKLQPTLSVPPAMLELNWVAGSKAELAVLWDLKQSYKQHDPDKCVKLSCRELELKYRPLLGNDANYRSISRAIHRLNAKGLIEATTPGPKAAQNLRINMPAVHAELEALRVLPLQELWS